VLKHSNGNKCSQLVIIVHRKKGKIKRIQAGFTRGCSTMDHIAQLETDIQIGFSMKKSTVAVFLDIGKA
jgi:hypothetical protein